MFHLTNISSVNNIILLKYNTEFNLYKILLLSEDLFIYWNIVLTIKSIKKYILSFSLFKLRTFIVFIKEKNTHNNFKYNKTFYSEGDNYTNYLQAKRDLVLVLNRDVSKEEIINIDMKRMPGFSLSWSYSGQLPELHKLNDDDLFLKNEFVR